MARVGDAFLLVHSLGKFEWWCTLLPQTQTHTRRLASNVGRLGLARGRGSVLTSPGDCNRKRKRGRLPDGNAEDSDGDQTGGGFGSGGSVFADGGGLVKKTPSSAAAAAAAAATTTATDPAPSSPSVQVLSASNTEQAIRVWPATVAVLVSCEHARVM